MKFSNWPDGAYPIYIDPDWSDVVALVATRPDTIRICEGFGGFGPQLALASGYGNTHETIVKMVHGLGDRRWNPTAYILHRENSLEWLMNSDGQIEHKNHERLTLAQARSFLESRTIEFWEDLNTLWIY